VGPMNRGFALIVVLWVVAILSSVSLALIASTHAEARNAAEQWDEIAGQQLARSGQELALYLRTRGLTATSENLAGLPIDVVTPGYRYSIRLPEGTVDLILESDAGKINPLTADRQILQNFFTLWTGDAASGVLIADSIKSWNEQNHRVGIADLPVIRGLSWRDFYPSIATDSSALKVRDSLDEFITPVPVGPLVNPNFAPKLVLLSIPDLGANYVDALIEARKRGTFFKNADEMRAVTPIRADSPVWSHFRFDRGAGPSVLTMTESRPGQRRYMERRVWETIFSNRSSTERLDRVAADRVPEFLRN
jgi:hypothetical protein